MYFDKFALSRRGFLGRSLLGVTAATGAGLALPSLARADTTLERAKSAGFVRVGFANEAPFGFADESGKLTGEAPVVLTYILKKMGIAEVDGVLTEFGSLIPGLKAGRFDIIAAGMYVKPDRCAQILFSEPTYSISEAFAVKAGNPLKLATYAEIAANPEVKLGVMTGAIQKDYAMKSGVKPDQVSSFPDTPSAIAALRADRVDVVAATSLTIGDMIRKSGSDSGIEALKPFSKVGSESVVGHGAFGFRKDDADFRDAVNAELKGFIGSPEHLKLVEPFGFSKYTLPVLTTEQICSGNT
jgi:polar amino acid transport system substrate-binding protein